MKEFINDTFNKKHKFLMFAGFFVLYFLLRCLANWFIEDDITWVSNLISSVFFAAVMTFLFILSDKQFKNNLSKDVNSALNDDESIQIEVSAGQVSGIIVYGGRLVLLINDFFSSLNPVFFRKIKYGF